jgi:hypothetical protein
VQSVFFAVDKKPYPGIILKEAQGKGIIDIEACCYSL